MSRWRNWVQGLVLITYTALLGYRCHQKGEAECVGRKEKVVFITGMALVGLGKATRLAFSQPLIVEEDEAEDEDQMISAHLDGPSCMMLPGGQICAYLRLIFVILFFVTPAVAFFAFPYVKKWYILFGVSAACTALATLSHLSRLCRYEKPGQNAASMLDHYLSICNKATMKLFNAATSTEFETSSETLLSILRINNVVVRTGVLYSTYIVCGVVSSIGNTYFVQQATQMNYNIGHWKPPLQVLQLIFLAFKLIYAGAFNSQLSSVHTGLELNSLMAMVYSAVCCAVAAAVERRRVHAVRRHHLGDQPDDVKIPMSAFWLLFQVCFLGMVEASHRYGLSNFHKEDGAPESMNKYGDCLGEAVIGMGYMCSTVLSVYVVEKISETGGGKGWFHHTLNRSRLDRYYWVLTALCAVYAFVYMFWFAIAVGKVDFVGEVDNESEA